MSSFTKRLLAPFQVALKQSIEGYVRLETVDDEVTLVAKDGSLVSYLRVDGSRQVIGEEEYEYLIEGSTIKIGARFDRQGHALQVYFTRDPERIEQHLQKLIRPSRVTAQACDLEIEDLFDERVRHLSHYLSYEECYFVLWTRPSVLTKNERQRALKEARNKKWVRAPYAMYPLAALDALRTRHKSFVSAISASLDELGIRAELLPIREALRAVRDNMFPTKANEE